MNVLKYSIKVFDDHENMVMTRIVNFRELQRIIEDVDCAVHLGLYAEFRVHPVYEEVSVDA